MDANTERMLTDLPIDIWAQGWELVPNEVHVLDEQGGGRHIAVYVRPYDRALDDSHPNPGYIMRRSGASFIRVSTYAVGCQSWDAAITAAISRMRAVDAQRRPALR